ncbi:helix-turn-helix domain-containing protein [Enterococcus devriesei]|uniref:helix-turn-helix domain-containing protein n=2 Tax=Enterococcus devriesei TaxID=319970 RepID=UPI0036D3B810
MDFRQILGTSSLRRLNIVEVLYYNRDGLPNEKLLSELGCSLPILLNDMNVINELQDNFFIEKEKGLYRLTLRNDVSIGKLYSEVLTNSPEFQIVEQLLYERCDNIAELSKLLYLSSSNTQRYLKKIEKVLRVAGIRLYYRPLRLEGKESVIRHFYYRYFLEKQYSLNVALPDLKEYQLKSIEQFVLAFTEINGLYKKYIFQKRVAYNVFISLWRIKNGHHYPTKELRRRGLSLPKTEDITKFRDTVSEVFRLDLTDDLLRDCLWLSFSDSVVFSQAHREAAIEDNPRYSYLFETHLELTDRFVKLLGKPIDETYRRELTTVLVNDSYLYDENRDFLTILRKSRTIFLKMVRIMHKYAVDKVTETVTEFVQKHQFYKTEDFITNYVYLLLTEEVDSLEELANQEETVHLLLISDLSPTEEKFITKIISQIVYGNFEIHHYEGSLKDNGDLFKKILTYDGLITTGSSEGVPASFPLISMDPYVTPQSIVAIQNLVNELSEAKSKRSKQ